MKLKTLILGIAVFSICSCQNGPNQNGSETANTLFELAQGDKTHEFRDARTGLTVVTSQYPSNWKVISKPVYTMDQKLPVFLTQIQGPNNLQAFNTPIQFNIDYPDPQMRQWMKQYSRLGRLIKPMPSKNQIMQSEVNKRMINSGFSLMGHKKMPRTERYIRKMMDEKGAQQANFEHYATEWTNKKGQKALVSLVTVTMEQPVLGSKMVLWFYSLDYTFVDEDKFDSTIDKMADIAEGSKETKQWQDYVAQLTKTRQQKALRDHRIHMNNRQAAFDAHQAKMRGIWAAQDMNHAAFMNRNFGPGSDRGQRQFVNMINEEETVYNPSTGRNYQVNAGSQEYWMDSDGNYIANDNLFYNPNGDLNLNHKEWTKVKKVF